MDCDVGLFSSDIDVPTSQQPELTDPLCSIYPILDDENKVDNMGLENTWTDDEFVVPPAPDLPALIPASTVDVITFEDTTPLSTPLLEDINCLFTPPVQTIESQDDPLFDSGVVGVRCGEPGVCGLQNLGNTCFMNSGIQCLVATAPISVELSQTPYRPQRRLTNAFADLMRKIWSGECLVIQPSQFKMALASHFPQFNDFRQHDCQEFLALMLDGLHEQLNTAGSKSGATSSELKDIRSPKVFKPIAVEEGDQSTSFLLEEEDRKSEDEILELVHEVSKKQKKESNLEKSNQVGGDFLSAISSPGSSSDEADSQDSALCDDPLEINPARSDRQILNNQLPLATPSSSAKEGIPVLNSVPSMNGFDDILKEAKTSKLNVLVKKEEANNEIRFDSDKFPRAHPNRSKVEKLGINSLQVDNGSYGKRNSYFSNNLFTLDFNEGLDLKRVKLHSNIDEMREKNQKMELDRRRKSPELLLEKNERMECERKITKDDVLQDGLGSSLLSPNLANITIDKTSEAEADRHWQKHLAENKSVVVNTFQGQFKSTVVCSVCKYISVTYEPFMYLSVPLPNAMQKKLKVTFIGESLKHPTEFLLELNKYDTVSYLRDQILLKVGCEVKGPILIAEVFDHHIAKFLEEHQLIRNLNDSERSLYAFEVKTLLDETVVEPIGDRKVEEYVGPTACSICLEDKDSSMKQHEDCSCVLCDTCVGALCNHYGRSSFDCPVCRKETLPDVGLRPLKYQESSHSRMMNIPVVFRLDTTGDGNNNQNHVELFGHPMVIRIPSRCSADSLREAISALLHYKEPFRLLLVDGQGTRCSRCLFGQHCRGCDLPPEVSLSSQDSLAVTFTSQVGVLPTTSSIALLSSQASSLTLYDCIQAFSQSEVLDGNNPWFCPQCKQNRSATKTLSVWRYPDYLIVYLKRFVFHNHLSTKLEEKVLFPLTGLSLASGSDYDLYACVCHIGGVSAGHYTTYAQHPYSGQWHFFNDNCVSKQSPVEDDYSNAYILFYKKQGLQPPPMDSANQGEYEF